MGDAAQCSFEIFNADGRARDQCEASAFQAPRQKPDQLVVEALDQQPIERHVLLRGDSCRRHGQQVGGDVGLEEQFVDRFAESSRSR